MSLDTQRQIRENTLELQEFLKDLKQWETKVKEKDKTLKSQIQDNVSDLPPIRGRGDSTHVSGNISDSLKVQSNKRSAASAKSVGGTTKDTSNTAARHTYENFHDKWDKFDVDAALQEVDKDEGHEDDKKLKKGSKSEVLGAPSHKGFIFPSKSEGERTTQFEDLRKFQSAPKSSSSSVFSEANALKELGNKYFKEKKFVQAIETYSGSIALQPIAASYVNRAMAYIKIRRFKEAESDCTDALDLDDRYVKAYYQRATARKELGNYVGAVEDAEFALRLEPENKELKQQYLEAKSMCQKTLELKNKEKKHPVPIEEIMSQEVTNAEQIDQDTIGLTDQKPEQGSAVHNLRDSSKLKQQASDNNDTALASVQAVAAQAVAARAMTHAVLEAPKTFYEFEGVWKGMSGNPSQQADLLKVIKASNLPSLLKDHLTPKLLSEIIRCLEHLFPENVDQAIEILEKLAESKRFDITVLCLTTKDKSDLRILWDKVFVGGEAAQDRVNTLNTLRLKYKF